MNTISAAVLEVAIMGIFVIIAQPQLREALFEIMHVDQTPAATGLANLNGNSQSNRTANGTDRVNVDRAVLDRTVQAIANSPVAQAVENSLHQWATGTSASSTLRDQPGDRNVAVNHMAGYSPFDQYEAFRVNVPANTPATTQYAVPTYSPPNYSAPQYVPPQTYSQYNSYPNQNFSNQTYAPTQLNANQWNIASANQSVRPGTSNNHWTPPNVTETSYRQVYPPPYGTQSMWK